MDKANENAEHQRETASGDLPYLLIKQANTQKMLADLSGDARSAILEETS